MTPEINVGSYVCSRCGRSYPARRGYFPINYGALYKGVGYITICKDCIDSMYGEYLAECGSAKDAVRQMCRKLDLYWSEKMYERAEKKSTVYTMMNGYMAAINIQANTGKSYDDTLLEEGALWNFIESDEPDTEPEPEPEPTQETNAIEETDIEFFSPIRTVPNDDIDVTDDVVMFWGGGYTDDMYVELERRRKQWMKKLGVEDPSTLDGGTETLIRQICAADVDVNRYRAEGNYQAADKSMNTLNTLLGSANLKPVQKKDDTSNQYDNTPMGVWIKRWEDYRPIPEPDPEFKDENKIVKYISTWFYGHLCKMLNIKNSYCRLYEDEMDKYRVDKPEIDNDEELFDEVFNDEMSVDEFDEV